MATIKSRELSVVRRVTLPDLDVEMAWGHMPDGSVVVRRFAERGKVTNLLDHCEWFHTDGSVDQRPLDEQTANLILDRVSAGEAYSSSYIFYQSPPAQPLSMEKSEEEHLYTSTGIKFWRHPAQMESYRAGQGTSVVSTHISPEGACNLRCPYCSVTYRDTKSRIALPVIKDYVEKLQSRGLKAVILTGGGEPTLYPHFDELVQWLHYERGLSVALITNGTTGTKVADRSWAAFSWVRVSLNIFDGWQEKISLPKDKLSPACVVGCSFVHTVEHEASATRPKDEVALFKQLSAVADQCGATYIRVLPNCLLEQMDLLAQHTILDKVLSQVEDKRFFHQHKVHGTPKAHRCHQAHFRPYLSEEPFEGTGEPGTVYPCDSVVLNSSCQHFAPLYQICQAGDVLDFLDRKIEMKFNPQEHCSGCVFTDNVNMLDDWVEHGVHRFDDFCDPLTHEEFV